MHHLIDVQNNKKGWLNRLDGRIKVLLLVAALLLNLVAADGLTSLSLFLFGCLLILAGGVSLRQYVRRMLVPSILALVALLTQLVWVDAGETLWAFSLLGFEGSVTGGGLNQGVELALRILGGMSMLLGFALTTPLPELMRATRFFRCPELLVELALIMYRYIFLLLDEALRIRTAQRARLGYGQFRSGIRSSGILGGMLLLRSFDRADRSFAAMRCRGYRGALVQTEPRRLLATDWTALCAGLVLLGGIYGLH